jgi:putative endonuclease
MYTVYILEDKNNKLYKGLTNNLKRRLLEHKSGHTITTSRMKDIEIIYREDYDNFEEARKRELYFKTAAGRRFIKKKCVVSSVGRAGDS